MPSVSVIIPHFNDLDGLASCLVSLENQTLDAAASVEIIVADNASTISQDCLETVIAGRARLVLVEEKGAGPARNGGARAASGEILAFTDSDCVPAQDWLRNGIAALSGADIIGGRMVVLVEHDGRKSGAEAFEQVFAFNNEKYVRKDGFSVTANLFCKSTTFEAVGGFKTSVSEDVEWCRRATGAGYRLAFCKDAIVGHPARKDWNELVRKWRRIDEETFALHRHAGKSLARWLSRAGMVAVSILPHAAKILFDRNLKGLGERWSAFKTLARMRIWRFNHYIRLAFTTRE